MDEFDRALLAGAAAEIGTEPDALRRQLDSLYRPVAEWVRPRLARVRPFVLGLSGPQGGGKSTLAAALVAGFRAAGLRAVRLSTDDVYLTRAQQDELAAQHPHNPYLQQRGWPGTHDVALGERVLAALQAGEPTELPHYDKSAHGGRGDRAARTTRVSDAQDLVIFEGWTLGFEPAGATDPTLAEIDALLAPYAAWHRRLDGLVVLRAGAPSDIVRWRVESEMARHARGETTLGEAGARAYVERCLPAYETYLPGLWAHPPLAARADALGVELGPAREGIRSTLLPAPSRGA